MKNGAPMNAVTTPIGVSAGFGQHPAGDVGEDQERRRRTSATAAADVGTHAPATRRMTCGMTRPTKPISPLTDTTAAVPSVAVTTMTSRDRDTDMPSVAASTSPTRNTSSCRRCRISTIELMITYGSDQQDVRPRRTRQPAEHPLEHLADHLVVALQDERLHRGRERHDGDPGQHQRRARPAAAARPTTPRRADRR